MIILGLRHRVFPSRGELAVRMLDQDLATSVYTSLRFHLNDGSRPDAVIVFMITVRPCAQTLAWLMPEKQDEGQTVVREPLPGRWLGMK